MDILEKLKNITKEENILTNEPMSRHTTFKVGGTADYLVTPETIEELKEILKISTPKTIIGNGSNILVTDLGIRGIVIKLSKINFCKINKEEMYVGAGLPLAKASQIAAENSLSGLEFACGIPGTIGGAIVMNAGAYGREIKDVVTETEYIDENNKIKKITDHKFSYRKSIFTEEIKGTIISSRLKLKYSNIEEIKKQMNENMKARKEKQPIEMPSAGSTFKRPEGYFAAKLIDDAGLRGKKIGGAMVSTKHTGFVINNDNATAKDILELIEYIQKVVKEKFNVELATEIKIIGEK